MHKFNCIYCERESESWISTSKVCKDKSCQKKKKSDKYKINTKEKKCVQCSCEFIGTKQTVNCENCRGLKRKKNINATRNILCNKCDNVTSTENVLVGKGASIKDGKVKPLRGVSPCEDCRKQLSEERRLKMTGEGNPSWVGGPNFHKRQKSGKTGEQIRQEASDRMINNNPTASEDVRNKISETLKNKSKKGEIIYKKGKDHHLWKGNRTRSSTIRSRLYKFWNFPKLQDAKFSCQNCGASKCTLEVHHNQETFAEIVNKILKNNILDDLSSEEFEIFCENVINYHLEKNISGIVVCIDCHRKLDPQRK